VSQILLTLERNFHSHVFMLYIAKEFFPLLRTYDIIKNPVKEVFKPIEILTEKQLKLLRKQSSIDISHKWILNEQQHNKFTKSIRRHATEMMKLKNSDMSQPEELVSYPEQNVLVVHSNPYLMNDVTPTSSQIEFNNQ